MLRRFDNDISDTIVSVFVIVIIIALFFKWYEREDCDIDDIEHVMMDFHNVPDYDDFLYVVKNKKSLPSLDKLDYWLYGVYESQPQFIKYAEVTMGKLLPDDVCRKVERSIIRVQRAPTAKLLDCIWAIYFASGNPKYPAIIADVACGRTNASILVRESASWSYNSIMGRRPV